MNQCLISFGSNLGDRDAVIADAARVIASSGVSENFRASRLYQTPPIGGPGGQEPFLNAVAAFDTTTSARDILAMLQATEDQLGRRRRQRWGARSIDLDVVLHGELIGGGTGLVVPHPRYTARQFVLQPALDVAPNYRDPRFGWTIEQISKHLSQGAASMALIGGDEAERAEICRRLRDEFDITTFEHDPASPATIPPTDAAQWVSSFVPKLPDPTLSGRDDDATAQKNVPRLITRMQRTTPQTSWPAPHQMWPAGGQWPEYRLEVDDMTWAVSEIVSALVSMRCPIHAVTDDGGWW